jgi:hypothetical protein
MTSGVSIRSDPANVVNVLLEKTRSGRLKWEAAPQEDTFQVNIGGHTYLRVFLVKSQQRNAMGDVEAHTVPTLHMLDEKGRVIWTVDSRSVSETRELHRQAQSRADRVEERIAVLLDTLSKM